MSPSTRDKIYPVAKIAMIVDLLAKEGIPAEEALAGVSLSPEQLLSPETKVSTAQVVRACHNAFKLSKDSQFPYRAGLKFCVSTYGLYGFAALSSPDFRETIAFAVAYHQLATPLMRVDFREEDRVAAWVVTPLPNLEIDEPLYEFILKLHMAVLLSLHRKLMGAAFKPMLVGYALARPHGDGGEAAFFDCPVLYGQPENRFAFDVAWLDRRPDFGNEYVYTELRRRCDGILKEAELSAGTAGEVRKLLFSSLSQPVGFEQVAKCLNMSERSLRRRLREEGTSFRQLADEVRVQFAIKYVRDTDLSVEDIAFALGFSDASSFRQAFRRWTNVAPNEYRRAADATRRETGDSPGW